MKYTEWIDNYVDGELDAAQMKDFEAALSSNKELAVEYRMEKDIQDALNDSEILDFRAKCLAAQEEVKISTSKMGKLVHLTRRYWYAAASLVLIALVAGGVLLFNPGSYTGEKLFKMYYKSGEAMEFRSGNVTMAEALLSFGKSDYSTAAQLFDQILANDPNNYAVIYYKGISNIELKDFASAIQSFQKILDDNNSLYTEYAGWYLGLSYLATEKPHEAEVVFDAIASTPGHLYQKEAASILEKLEKSGKNKKFINNLFFLILPF
jgi:tetratricopeptide (TPR) repeat protein